MITAAEMGYGHLRPAQSIADALGLPVHRVDAPPLAAASEVRTWARHRRGYETVSRLTQFRFIGGPFRAFLEYMTKIEPLHPRRDQSRPTRSVKALANLLGPEAMTGLFDLVHERGGPLVTTFYAPAIAADLRGLKDIYCLVTDSDIHRIWAPPDPANTSINYLVPSMRALRRLRAYGVPRERIEFTGFPLPGELVKDGNRNFAARLFRLDPEGAFRRGLGPEVEDLFGELPQPGSDRPPLLTLAVGGAGAQVGAVLELMGGLRPSLARGDLQVALVAGVHSHVAERFNEWLAAAGFRADRGEAVRVLFEPEFIDYYRAFNELLAETDILWTKPSEMVFYAALGIPLLLSSPIGYQERYNRRFLLERGAALDQRDARFAGQWIEEMLSEGTLAAAAWAGYHGLPQSGTDRIVELIRQVL